MERVWKPRSDRKLPPPEEIPRLIWDILCARGIESVEMAKQHLSPSLKDLRDPLSIRDMDLAVERLKKAYQNDETVCVYADYDLDGTSGLALLSEGLRLLGFSKVQTYQPRRLSEGYGVHINAIRDLKTAGVNVIITVDVGITAFEAAAEAKSLGMDFVVTDHHLPAETLPDAHCIVNPNRTDCVSKLGHLSGVGVAFYFVLALRREFLAAGLLKNDFNPKDLLDCFVIGTLTDMVPLRDENRVLVKHGLKQLAQTRRSGLRRLREALGIPGETLTSQDVVLTFAPKLNALSRLDLGLLPADLFLVEDDDEADRMVQQMLKSNETRKTYQASAEKRAFELAGETAHQGFVWVWSEEFHKGVVGLVATKLSQHFQVPAFVGTIHETGEIVGSARVPDGCSENLLEIFDSAKDVLARSGGHARAAGFAVQKGRPDEFRQRLIAWFEGRKTEKLVRHFLYDTEADLEDVNPVNLNWYQHLEPFGTQFPVPVLLFDALLVLKVKVLKGGHLKLTVSQKGREMEALFFGPPKDLEVEAGQKVSALGRIHWNHYNGQSRVQLQLEDLKPLC